MAGGDANGKSLKKLLDRILVATRIVSLFRKKQSGVRAKRPIRVCFASDSRHFLLAEQQRHIDGSGEPVRWLLSFVASFAFTISSVVHLDNGNKKIDQLIRYVRSWLKKRSFTAPPSAHP